MTGTTPTITARATLAIADGFLSLEIPARDGQAGLYAMFPDRRRDGWACRLSALEGDGPDYTVTERRGFWSCTCPAFRFSRREDRGCKHLIAVQSLRQILEALDKGRATR